MSDRSEHRFTPRRELGRTGFTATVLGIGDLADRRLPIEQCISTAWRAIEAGLNLIDTAPGYEDGYSEEIVGRAVRSVRDRMFVIDKIDQLDQPVEPQIDASLQRLKLNHTDAFVFHGLSTIEGWNKIAAPGGGMDQLKKCIQSGKARFAGISSHDPDTLHLALQSSLCDIVMFPIGPYVHPRYVMEILPLAKKMGVGTVCFKTFGAGKLVGDTIGYNQPLSDRPRGKVSSGGSTSELAPSLPHLTIEECLHYTLTCDPDVALLGLSFPNEQDSAFKTAQSFKPLHSDAMADIKRRAVQAISGKGKCWWNPGGV